LRQSKRNISVGVKRLEYFSFCQTIISVSVKQIEYF
jgi:hypothetical protein